MYIDPRLYVGPETEPSDHPISVYPLLETPSDGRVIALFGCASLEGTVPVPPLTLNDAVNLSGMSSVTIIYHSTFDALT